MSKGAELADWLGLLYSMAEIALPFIIGLLVAKWHWGE